VQTIRTVAELRAATAPWRAVGERIALVPTMGALHAGHLALVDEARRAADRVVTSIFVNPKQFGLGEDLASYPRREAKDRVMLEEARCDLLWAPAVEDMYPEGFATTVSVSGLSGLLDGAARPGHFDGVATVVTKLFNQVRPDVAVFGEKDFQQLAVIRRMVADLDLGIEIVGVRTQRDDDGLALSSRNAYLTDGERARALVLPRALGQAAEAIRAGGSPEEVTGTAERVLADGGFTVDYVALVDAETLTPDPAADRPRRLLAAARIGRTRLIDNLEV
jgi:pantoate--beta-alanine ligase